VIIGNLDGVNYGINIYDAAGNTVLSNAGIPASKITGQLSTSSISGLGTLATQSSISVGSGQITGLGTLATASSVSMSQIPDKGAFATLNQLTSANLGTYMAAAAIGDAYIGSLNATKIVAGSITSTQLAATIMQGKTYLIGTATDYSQAGYFALEGNTQRFILKDYNNRERIRFGYLSDNTPGTDVANYGLYIYDANGNQIITANGIGAGAVSQSYNSFNGGTKYTGGTQYYTDSQGHWYSMASISVSSLGLSAKLLLSVSALISGDASPTGTSTGGGGGYGGPSCFLAGTLVAMADGTYKPIEQIVPGEQLKGAFGTINTVLALDWVVLGDRWMYQINNDHHTSDDHPHVSADGKFYSCEPDAAYAEWGNYYPVITSDGTVKQWKNIGLIDHPVNEMTTNIMLHTLSGPRNVDSITPYRLDPSTKLYNLVMGGSHTYFVNGYAVTGWPREDDWDYNTWLPTGKILTLDDYT
jgi:hypothetical protein